MDIVRKAHDHAHVRGVGRQIEINGKIHRFAVPVAEDMSDAQAIEFAKRHLDAWEAATRAAQ